RESVVCLSVNIDGTLLASGGVDNEIKIWHVTSRQCIKTIHCKGKPRRAEFHVKFPALSGNCAARMPVVHPLQKVVNEKVDENLTIRLFGTSNSADEREFVDQLMENLLQEEKSQQFTTLQAGKDDRDLSQDVEYLRRELAKTKKINKHLYDMCVNFATK
uniref:WD repeat-containing protein 18 n=1 Tax=Romanomermis culicivorax TaxID=13658 RepID=A0A915KFS9_ROMCU